VKNDSPGLQFADETGGLLQIGNGAGFRDFKADHPRRNGIADKLAADEVEEIVIAQSAPDKLMAHSEME
jgi:hypothetical protein